MYQNLNSSPPLTMEQEHPSVSNRERFKAVVAYSLQLLFILAGIVGYKLGTPIHTFINKMPGLSTFLIELFSAFHIFFVFVLVTTTIQQNGAILESLVIYVMNGILSYIFVNYLDHFYATLSIIFWVTAVVIISIIKREDLSAQCKTLKLGFSSFLAVVRDAIKFLWNGFKGWLRGAVGWLKDLCCCCFCGNNTAEEEEEEEVTSTTDDQVPPNINNT